MVKTCNCKHHQKKHGLKEEVIRVPKVYDWVNDSIKVKKEVFFGEEERWAIERALEDPKRRPLRIVAKAPQTPPVFPLRNSDPDHHHDHKFYCEQLGEKRHVVVPIGGEFVDAEEVTLLFNAEIEIAVVDRHGHLVTEACVDVTAIDTFVLCFPNGTELLCRIQRILAEIESNTILLNARCPESFLLEVIFCVDIQTEAEVKLEVLGKFASPRENNLEAIEEEHEACPPVTFPHQCPSIFPVHQSVCEGKGEASGETHHPQGRASILVHLSSRNLENGRFDFTFEPNHDSDDAFTFVATSFDEDSLHCESYDKGHKLEVRGKGHTEDHVELDFRLALLDSPNGDQFEVKLIDPHNHHDVFHTGTVKVQHGHIEVHQ